ncbi:MAG: hypothetical protein DRQ40_09590 [Gammaproteobacteria bacterium]|nr:MAG: hypothetical protein DRQ40_09590 [Gammaproteobacteria bacterium]
MAVTGDTQLNATKMEIIAEIAQRALIDAMTTSGTVRDVSQFAVKGNDQISFPKNTNFFTVENRASAAAGTDQDITFANDTLNLEFRAHIQWLIDSNDEIQSRLDVKREYIQRAAMQQGAYVDTQVFAEMEAKAITTTTAGNISQDLVLEMRRVLLKNKANPSNIWLQISPLQEALLLKIDPFVSAEKYGSAIIPAGVLGTLYGVKVKVNTSLADNAFYMYDTEGMALGFQRQPQFDEEKAVSFGPGAVRQVLGQLFGCEAMQIGAPGAFLADGSTAITTQSALIVKDNN